MPCLVLCYKLSQDAEEGGLVQYCEPVRPFPMRDLAALVVLSGTVVVLAWNYVTQPMPPDDQQAYAQCVQLHPKRYCGITYLPNSFDKQR